MGRRSLAGGSILDGIYGLGDLKLLGYCTLTTRTFHLYILHLTWVG